jgi:hypothetical protein
MAEIRVNATGAVKFYDNDDSNFVGLQAGSISSDVTFTLPTADGSNGQALTTNGSGALSFSTISSNTPSSADGQALGSTSAEWSDLYLADGGIIYFGNDQDITLTHDPDDGLFLKSIATGDDNPVLFTLQTGETDLAADDVIGKIAFQAPDEGTGTDAILVSAAIQAVAEGDHSSSSNATRLEFMVGASEAAAKKMQLTSAGKLEVDGGIDIEGGAVFNEDSADVDFRVESNGNANMFVVNGGGDRVGIGADPDLGVGLHIKTGDSGASVNTDADQLVIETSSGSGGMSILSATDGTGDIYFGDSGNNASGYIQYNHTDNFMRFAVNGASEKMRLKSNGYLGVTNTAGTGIERRLSVYGSHVSEDGLVWIQTTNGSGDDNLVLFFDGNTNNCGEITLDASGNTVAYVTSSDYRLKQNATDIADGITRLKQLKPYRFQWKSDPDKTVDGFFAHEAQEIVPEAVKGTKDAMKTAENVVVNSDGTVECYNISQADWEQGKIDGKYASNSTWEATKEVIDRQGIDQAKLVPLLTAALKESIAKIEALEARVTTLEG